MPNGTQLQPSIAGPGFYLGPDDNLRLTVYNSLTAVRVTVAGRLLNAQSMQVESFVHEFTPTSDRVASVLTRRLTAGWLLNLHVYASNASPLIGQTFGIVSIVKGQTGFVDDLSTLCAGYITAKQRIAWPGGIIQNSLDGAGALRKIQGTNPAAGAEISETVPTGARWQFLALKFLLTTSATVANRAPTLTIDDGNSANFYAIVGNGTTQAASIAATWYYLPNIVASGRNHQLMDPFLLPAGHRITTSTASIQVGDQYSEIHYVVREWLEGN